MTSRPPRAGEGVAGCFDEFVLGVALLVGALALVVRAVRSVRTNPQGR